MGDFKTIFELLEKRYEGRLLVGVKEVAVIFDVSEKTVYKR